MVIPLYYLLGNTIRNRSRRSNVSMVIDSLDLTSFQLIATICYDLIGRSVPFILREHICSSVLCRRTLGVEHIELDRTDLLFVGTRWAQPRGRHSLTDFSCDSEFRNVPLRKKKRKKNIIG